jgi:hypothetical protein
MDGLQTEYNRLLDIYSRACRYLDDMTISAARRESTIPVFRKIIAKMNIVMMAIRAAGHDMTDAETFQGFVETEDDISCERNNLLTDYKKLATLDTRLSAFRMKAAQTKTRNRWG